MKTVQTLLIAGLLAVSMPALSHTGIKTTYPSNEQMMEKAPEQLTLTFGAPVKLMKVTLMDDEHDTVEIDFKPTASADKTFKVALPKLPMGNYLVEWVSLGGDGHKMSGDFSFMVHGEGMSHDDHMAHDDEKHSAHTDGHSGEHGH